MKFLITGDVQAHAWKQFAYTRKSGMNSRLYNCLRVFDVLLEEAKKRDITKILINGDVFEENSYIDVETWDPTYLKFEKLYDAGMEIVVNIGNHDVARQSQRRILHCLRALRGVATIVEKSQQVWENLFVVPWDVSPDRIKETISSSHPTKETCLVGHFGVQGAKTGPTGYLVRNPIKLKDLRADEFGLVLLSDYHTRQRLAKNVWYLGSPLQHSFGEIHRPCIWAISLDRNQIFKTEKIYTDFPQFRRIKATDLSQFRKDASAFSGDYIRVETGGDGKVDEDGIRRVAEEIGFHYQIRNGSEGEDSVLFENPTRVLDTRKAFKQYVRREARRGTARRRLLRLGDKLYRGEL